MVTLHTQRNRGQRVSIRYILSVSTGTSTSAVSQLCKSFRCQNLPQICFFQQQLGILDHVLGVPQVILAKVFSRSAGPSSQKYESFMYDIYFGGLLLPQKQWNVNVDEGLLLGCGTRARCGHLHRQLFWVTWILREAKWGLKIAEWTHIFEKKHSVGRYGGMPLLK